MKIIRQIYLWRNTITRKKEAMDQSAVVEILGDFNIVNKIDQIWTRKLHNTDFLKEIYFSVLKIIP